MAKKLGAVRIVVDLIHVLEYLWRAAHALCGDGTKQAEAWVQQRLLWLLQDRPAGTIATAMRESARTARLGASPPNLVGLLERGEGKGVVWALRGLVHGLDARTGQGFPTRSRQWVNPVALTCTELFAKVEVHTDGGFGVTKFARVRLDSLGQSTPAD